MLRTIRGARLPAMQPHGPWNRRRKCLRNPRGFWNTLEVAATNKCLARTNKSHTRAEITKKRRKYYCNRTKGIMYGPSPLAVGILAIAVLVVLWRAVKGPVRFGELVFLGVLGFLFLMPWVDALIPDNLILALAFILAGVGK